MDRKIFNIFLLLASLIIIIVFIFLIIKDFKSQLTNFFDTILHRSKRSTSWKCIDAQYPQFPVPLRINATGDVECQSTDGRNCMWGRCPNLSDPTPSNPLVCGAMHQSLYGITGYDTPGHWCYVGKQVL